MNYDIISKNFFFWSTKLFYLNHQSSAIYLKPALTMGNTLQCLAQKKNCKQKHIHI